LKGVSSAEIAMAGDPKSGGRTMRLTLILDDALVDRARALTGLAETPALVREALNALIAREGGRGLARLGGSEPDAKAPPRRRC